MQKSTCQAEGCGKDIPGFHVDALSKQEHYEQFGNYCKKCLAKISLERQEKIMRDKEFKSMYKV